MFENGHSCSKILDYGRLRNLSPIRPALTPHPSIAQEGPAPVPPEVVREQGPDRLTAVMEMRRFAEEPWTVRVHQTMTRSS